MLMQAMDGNSQKGGDVFYEMIHPLPHQSVTGWSKFSKPLIDSCLQKIAPITLQNLVHLKKSVMCVCFLYEKSRDCHLNLH